MNINALCARKFPVALFLFCGLLSGSLHAQQIADKSILSIQRNERDNTPKNIVFAEDASYKIGDADMLFERYLGAGNTENHLVFANTTTTKRQISTNRYAQAYKGYKVADGAYTITTKNDLVRTMSGNFYKIDEPLSSTPAISKDEAFQNALKFIGAEKYMWQDAGMEARIKAQYHNNDTSYLPIGTLTWIEDYRSGTTAGKDGHLHLAYCFDIYAQKPLSRQLVYVDAQTGKILFKNAILEHTAASGHTLYSGVVNFQTSHVGVTYELYDSTRGNGVHTMNMNNGTDQTAATEFTSTANTWPSSIADTAALDAHWAAEKVYDYWDSVHNRLSWDNMNSILTQYVHYSTSYDNAFWDGAAMNYGDGSGVASGGFSPLVSLDVTGHEIGHGVCQATASLNYEGESGGMNEGFSDCWGATIEHWADPHEVDAVPKRTWKIGEEMGGGIPLRSMDTPKLQGQPDTYLGINWVATIGCVPTGGNDECGVHTNSGILNHWYYVLVHGASGTNDNSNTYSVTGIGFIEGADILYQTELTLVPTSQYFDCRVASQNAAAMLYGPCSPEYIAVTNAWYAVGVGDAFVPCTPQIGFVSTSSNVPELSGDTTCNSSHVEYVPIRPLGLTITGGTPSLTVNVSGGTAVEGADFVLPASPVFTFAPGDTTTKYLAVTIFDNGAVNDDKYFILGYTLNAMGSNAVVSLTNANDTIHITNDDKLPEPGHAGYYQINDSIVLSNLSSSFKGGSRTAHSQFLVLAEELTAFGIQPNAPILQLAFKVATKNSTVPYSNYTVGMANTILANMDGGFATEPLTTVYSANFSTFIGWDSLDFTTPFVWDGTSNVVVDVCFTNTSYSGVGNDKVDGYSGPISYTAYVTSNVASTVGCTLPYDPSQTSQAKPIMRFKQVVAPSKIETVAHRFRSWNVRSGQEVYFYAPADTGLMMSIKNPSMDLGCVNTTLSSEGIGFTPFPYSSGINRSKKEFSMTPTTNLSTTTYQATLYFSDTEMGTTPPASVYIIKTDATTDADITASNTSIITPTLVTGANYVGFTGNFTGFSRFFLVDGFISGIPGVSNAGANGFWVNNNPFHDKINLSYASTIESNGAIQLYDILGKQVFTQNIVFATGSHLITINCLASLPAGTYVLKVISAENFYTCKVIKE